MEEKRLMELANAVKQMREAQKAFFTAKSARALSECKEMERNVDRLIDKILSDADNTKRDDSEKQLSFGFL